MSLLCRLLSALVYLLIGNCIYHVYPLSIGYLSQDIVSLLAQIFVEGEGRQRSSLTLGIMNTNFQLQAPPLLSSNTLSVSPLCIGRWGFRPTLAKKLSAAPAWFQKKIAESLFRHVTGRAVLILRREKKENNILYPCVDLLETEVVHVFTRVWL